MKEVIQKRNFIYNVYHEKCPKCSQGFVFEQKTNILHLPIMYDTCEFCNYKYDREPGYFLGAMYLSYGLAVLQGILTFLICHYYFLALSTLWESIIVILVILICGRKNYKLSRILYIHIFPW